MSSAVDMLRDDLAQTFNHLIDTDVQTLLLYLVCSFAPLSIILLRNYLSQKTSATYNEIQWRGLLILHVRELVILQALGLGSLCLLIGQWLALHPIVMVTLLSTLLSIRLWIPNHDVEVSP